MLLIYIQIYITLRNYNTTYHIKKLIKYSSSTNLLLKLNIK